MINIYDFNNCKLSGETYGGHAGDKLGIEFNNSNWLVKFPKNTESLERVDISYTTTPLSEYLASHIYEILGIDVHETLMGVLDNHLVVACKDFRKLSEVLVDYNHIKNIYNPLVNIELEKKHLSTPSTKTSNLEELQIMMEINPIFEEHPGLKKRFWQMFIIDALISNNDRNEGNWGMLFNRETKEYSIAPVYDNGASFFSKSSDEKMQKIMESEELKRNAFYNNSSSIFDINEKIINPLKYIESMQNEDCTETLLELVPIIENNFDKIEELLNEIPEKYNNLEVMSNTRKEFYSMSLHYIFDNVLKPTYNKLKLAIV